MAETITRTSAINNRISLRVVASQESQSITNNTSRLKLVVHIVTRSTNTFNGYGTTVTTKVDGTQVGNKSISKFTGTTLVGTYYKTVTHNNEGKGTARVESNISVGKEGSTSVSFTYNFDNIPRASTITSVSGGSKIALGGNYSIDLSLDKKSSAYSHKIALVHRGSTVKTWNENSSSLTLHLYQADTNKILERELNNKATLSVQVTTKNGSNTIGSTQTKNLTVSLDTSENYPTSSSFSRSIVGNSTINNQDRIRNNPVAGFTRLSLSVKADAKLGADVGKVVMKITGPQEYDLELSYNKTTDRFVGTTKTVVAGSYHFQPVVTDSRGFTSNGIKQSYVVQVYVQPSITGFNATRQESNQSQVQLKANIKVSDKSDITVSYKADDDTLWTTIRQEEITSDAIVYYYSGDNRYYHQLLDKVDGIISYDFNQLFTGYQETKGYTFRISVVDEITGVPITITTNISTAKQLMSFREDIGVGIGKVHEQGALDVAGEAFFSGDLDLTGNAHMSGLSVDGPTKLKNTTVDGDFLVNGFPSGIESGSNSNGDWVKFPNGTAINIIKLTVSSNDNYVGLPLSYINTDYSIFINAQESSKWASGVQTATNNIGGAPNINRQLRLLRFGTSEDVDITITTIGRWK